MSIRRLSITTLTTLTVLAAGLTLTTSPVLAAGRVLHEFSKAFGTTGTGNGEFKEPVKVAIDEATSDVYVADQGNGRIQKFDAEGNYLSQFNGSETPNASPGEFSPRYLAVDNACIRHEPALTGTECEEYDPSAGDLYVVDTANNVVDKFSSAGGYISRLPAAGGPVTRSVAVDSTGNVIVTSSEGAPFFGAGEIAVYDDAASNSLLSSGFLLPVDHGVPEVSYGLAVRSDELLYFLAFGSFVEAANTSGEGDGEALFVGSGRFGGGATDLAIDLSTGELYADIGTAVRAYDESDSQVEEIGLGRIAGSAGVAVDSLTHTVYATDPANDSVEIFPSVPLPDVSLEPATSVQARSVTLNGIVLSKGGVETNAIQFEYTTTTGQHVTIPTSPSTCSAGGANCAVSATLTDLQPNTTYHYHLAASNTHGQQVTNEETITTSTEVPSIDGETVPVITQTSAIIIAHINPENDETTYHFEYGPDSKYGTTIPIPDGIVGSGYGDVNVREDLTGLQPNTTYHFRVVATSPAGAPVDGPDQTFTTTAPTPPVLGAVSAGEVSPNSVSLSGTVDPQGVQSFYEFDLGVDTSYGTSVFGDAGFTEVPVTVTAAFQGLAAGTVYHYRFVTTNIFGTTYGPDQTFTTPGYPAATLTAPVAPALLGIPTAAFPSNVVTTSTKTKKKTKKPPKKKKKKPKKAGKASRATHRHGGHGRSK